jgi:hypothetical protein
MGDDINEQRITLQVNQAVSELEIMKAQIRQAKSAYEDYERNNQRAIKASPRPDLKQPAFKDPTPVDPMLQRFACIEV